MPNQEKGETTSNKALNWGTIAYWPMILCPYRELRQVHFDSWQW